MNKIIGFLLLLSLSVIATAQDAIMTPVTPSQPAIDFTLPRPNGDLITLSDYQGKYVLINFWANWCSPCIKEFPDMQKLYEQSDKDNFEIIGIHAGPYNEQAAELVEHFNISFTIVSDAETRLKGWDVPALPMSYLISPQGDIIFKSLGPREWNASNMQALISTYEAALSNSAIMSMK